MQLIPVNNKPVPGVVLLPSGCCFYRVSSEYVRWKNIPKGNLAVKRLLLFLDVAANKPQLYYIVLLKTFLPNPSSVDKTDVWKVLSMLLGASCTLSLQPCDL